MVAYGFRNAFAYVFINAAEFFEVESDVNLAGAVVLVDIFHLRRKIAEYIDQIVEAVFYLIEIALIFFGYLRRQRAFRNFADVSDRHFDGFVVSVHHRVDARDNGSEFFRNG